MMILSASALRNLPLCLPRLACGKLRNSCGHVDQSLPFRILASAIQHFTHSQWELPTLGWISQLIDANGNRKSYFQRILQ